MPHAILTAEQHRALRVDPAVGADRGDAVMSCVVVPGEFRRVQGDFPILFRLTPDRDRFHAVAMFGFEAGENLFLDGDRWDARYRPLAMRIQPFLIGRQADDQGERQVHVDLDSPRIAHGGEGVALFDEVGRPSPYLDAVAEQLGELDAGWRGLDDFFAALARHELLEPLTLEITLENGSINRLVGYHAIDEDRLQALDAAALVDLHAAGHLLPVFMALASLSKVAELIARKNARGSRG